MYSKLNGAFKGTFKNNLEYPFYIQQISQNKHENHIYFSRQKNCKKIGTVRK